MAQAPITDAQKKLALATMAKHSTKREAARVLGLPESTFNRHLRAAIDYPVVEKSAPQDSPPDIMPEVLARRLRRGPMSLEDLANVFRTTEGHISSLASDLRSQGYRVERRSDGLLHINTDPSPAFISGPVFEYVSRPDNTFVFGACGDNHLGSKYARLDVLNSLYDIYEKEGVDRVFNT